MSGSKKSKYKVGDTVSIRTSKDFLVSGTIYINGSIPMEKFYRKLYSKEIGHEYEAECYEDAMVIIDDNKPGALTVLTLEEDDIKLFVWNDVFQKGSGDLNYKKILNGNDLYIEYESAILTEMKHSFR